MPQSRATLAVLVGASFALACTKAPPAVSPAPMDHAAVALADTSMAMDHSTMVMDHGGMAADVVIPPGVLYTVPDVRFMQMMIAHHAQAIYMSHLAATHGSDDRLLRFAQKIDQSQTAEIALMQGWLGDRHQFVPDTASYHSMTMPGMLTADQLAALAATHGTDFDRHFLQSMIRHHEGALGMVANLLGTPRAAQDIDVSVLANDIHLVQTAEIDVMRRMLAAYAESATASPPEP